MCGKFTAQAPWAKVVDFSQPLTGEGGGGDDGDGDGDGEIYTYRVGGNLPVIIWDAELGKRRIVPMRWGLPEGTTGLARTTSMRAPTQSKHCSRQWKA